MSPNSIDLAKGHFGIDKNATDEQTMDKLKYLTGLPEKTIKEVLDRQAELSQGLNIG